MSLHIMMPYCLQKLFDWLERKIRSHDSQEVPMETREFILKCIPILRKSVIYLHRVHLAFFYLRGIFYHIAKRFTGIEYVSNCIHIASSHAKIVLNSLSTSVLC